MSRRKKKSDDLGSNWMDTYADTITLLLTFFILLYSISSVDTQKLNELAEALKDSLKGSTKVEELKDLEDIKTNEDKSEKNQDKKEELEHEDLVKKLNNVIVQNALTDVVKIREEERGIVLQLDETILFDTGRSQLKPHSENILNTINTIITNIDNDVLIEGNTDNIPINNSEYASNWELSTDRAVSIVRYFVETKGLSPTRFSVKGYGEFKPLVANDTPENRSINRRVDVLIVEQRRNNSK